MTARPNGRQISCTLAAAPNILGNRTQASKSIGLSPSISDAHLPHRRRALATLLLIAVLGGWVDAAGQAPPPPDPPTGLVWSPPERTDRALAELDRIAELGATAVRTPLIRRDTLLARADSLELNVYQDLPVANLPGPALSDTLAGARSLLADALRRARDHPSARHFGLARGVDTSHPSACRYFSTLSEFTESRGAEGTDTYYTSWFTEADRCGTAVDFVLLGGPSEASPSDRLSRWHSAHPEVPVGSGEVGTWADSSRGSGYRIAHSLEYQARFFDRVLDTLRVLDPPPEVIFLQRWRDPTASVHPSRARLSIASSQQYGIAGRPAEDVVRGHLTGRQTVFGYAAGTPRSPSFTGRILLGWILVIGSGLLYALSPQFRSMVPRYFTNHTFYQDAVRRGREVLTVESTALLLILCTAGGLAGDVFLRAVDGSRAMAMCVSWWPADVRYWIAQLFESEWALIVLITGASGLLLTLWAAWITFAGQRLEAGLTFEQGFMIVIWSHWPLLVLGLLGWIGGAGPAVTPGLLAAGGAIGAAGAFLRIGRDFRAVTGCSPLIATATAALSPPAVLLVSASVLLYQVEPQVRFLVHLIVRT